MNNLSEGLIGGADKIIQPEDPIGTIRPGRVRLCSGVQRYKTSSPGGVLFQVVDSPHPVFLAFDDDVLKFLTQGGLYGGLILLRDFDMVCHQPVDIFLQRTAACHLQDASRPFVAPLMSLLKFSQGCKPRTLCPYRFLECFNLCVYAPEGILRSTKFFPRGDSPLLEEFDPLPVG